MPFSTRISARRGWATGLLLAAVIGAGSLSSTARAQPSPATIAGAQVLVGEGRKLRAAGDLAGARERFESAYLLVPTPIIGLDLGKARAALGYWIEARAILLESSALPPIAKESDESKAARAESIALAQSLEERTPTLAVVIEGLEVGIKVNVAVDGADVSDGDAKTPRKVNPGKHVIVVRADGRLQRVEVEVAEKEAKTATVTFPKIAPPEPPRAPESKPLPPPPETRVSKLAYIGFAVAGAGVVVGSVTGILALTRAHDLDTACEGYNFQCPPSTRSAYDSSRRYGNVSTASFIVGGAGLALGVYGLLNRETVPAAPRVSLSIGIGSVGLEGAF
jgi:hypothetical protein